MLHACDTGIESEGGIPLTQLPGYQPRLPIPLPAVPYGGILDIERVKSGASYPFDAFRARNQRLDTLTRLYEGDMSEFIGSDEDLRVPVNLFRRVATLTSDLLMIAPPEIEGVDFGDEFLNTFHEAVSDVTINSIIYGMGYFLVEVAAGEVSIESIAPSSVFRTNTGWAISDFVVTSSSLDGTPNQIEMLDIHEEGSAETSTRVFTGDAQNGVIGMEVESDTPTSLAAVIPVPRPPFDGTWGLSLYPDILPLVLELSRRYSGNSVVLSAHEHPKLVTWIDTQELETRGELFDPTASTLEEKLAAGKMDLASELRDDVLAVTATNQRVEYLTWDANLEASAAQIDRIKGEINAMTGIPSILEGEQNIPSGVALRRMLIPLYAATRSLQSSLTLRAQLAVQSLQVLMGQSPSATVLWMHPLEILDEPLNEPQEQEQEQSTFEAI